MGRALRSLAAVGLAFALVATALLPCPCPEQAAASPSGHECCAPPTGVSAAADHGCCDAHEGAASVLVPSPSPAPSLSEVAVPRLQPVARLEASPRLCLVLAPSPPPAILRL